MSTATTNTTTAPPPFEVPGPVTRVPSLDELERLTSIPDRRVVFRGVDWDFYDRLVESIPESSNIHVDYDGKDLEVMGNGPDHEWIAESFGQFVKAVAQERREYHAAAWDSRPGNGSSSRGASKPIGAFTSSPRNAAAAARAFGANDVSGYPNPDLAIEVDISRPAVDRAGIYAALRVPEVWRFEANQVVIDRLTADGTYATVDTSLFLPVRAEDIRRWIVDEDASDEIAWTERLQAEIKKRLMNQS